jgi:hypothetical protein
MILKKLTMRNSAISFLNIVMSKMKLKLANTTLQDCIVRNALKDSLVIQLKAVKMCVNPVPVHRQRIILLFLVIPSCLEVLRTSVNANPITSAIFAKVVEQDTLDNLMSLVTFANPVTATAILTSPIQMHVIAKRVFVRNVLKIPMETIANDVNHGFMVMLSNKLARSANAIDKVLKSVITIPDNVYVYQV